MELFEVTRDGFTVSTDPGRLDLALVHRVMSTEAYWAEGRPFEVVARSFAHSLPFGVYAPDGALAGWARVITDFAVHAYIADVWVMASHRGRGLSKFLVETMLAHPDLQGLKRWRLNTRDAHGLYAQFGFTPLEDPTRSMERR
ncbi:N-acetyltransferase [Aliidongia dinghuensis]|uniref:N-acetyltransferase n=1 Tax=Aliidongia dinghuensis TaxID=1867774 RepID=A0A8J2YSQ7_9PROT|nr:GNAT family N-acetyltransferase [Aliidongia dinghuensis]GGF16099.1 N-acetyltransferase [Aliidongia dinghuensis]